MTLTTAPTSAPPRPPRLKLAADVRHLDFVLLGAALALSLIGAALVYSATHAKLQANGDDPRLFLNKVIINIIVGMLLCWGVSTLGYRSLRASAWWVYGASVLLLVVVLTPLGTENNGTKGWLMLPAGFSLQPAELAKVGVILAVSLVLTQLGPSGAADSDVRPRSRYVVLALIIAGVPMLLILAQPDLGSVLLMIATVFGMLAVAGVSSRWLYGLAGLGILTIAFALTSGILEQYQIDRMTTFIHPDQDPLGAGYNTRMARLAIAGGGLWGTGLFHGPTTQGGFVPYQQTDFVFSVAGEELGVVGASVIILLVGVVLWRGIRIAKAAPDRYGRVMSAGVVTWIAVQAFENIGMNLGIMPVTGVPLPFVSYGGSSMFALWVGIGLLTSVHLRTGRSVR